MTRTVVVVKESRYTYTVEGECDDDKAIAMVRQRLDAGSPIGLVTETEKVMSFEVSEGSRHVSYNADGQRTVAEKARA